MEMRSMPDTSIETAVRKITDTLRVNPRGGVSYYYHTLWHAADPMSAQEFAARTASVTGVLTEGVATEPMVLEAGMNGALVGVMIARTLQPEFALDGIAISDMYRNIGERIVVNGAMTPKQRSEGVRSFAHGYELTLPLDSRARLKLLSNDLSEAHEDTAYTMALFSMYAASEIMGMSRDMHSVLEALPEKEFDQMLDAIATGTWELV